MGLFGNTAKRLASRPAVLFAVEPAKMADAVTSYDPGLQVRGDRFVFGPADIRRWQPRRGRTQLTIRWLGGGAGRCP
jgi:hypothetical protein